MAKAIETMNSVARLHHLICEIGIFLIQMKINFYLSIVKLIHFPVNLIGDLFRSNCLVFVFVYTL